MATKALERTGKLPVFFDDFFKPWNEWFDNGSTIFNRMLTVPAVNVTETKENFMVTLAVPGMKKEDFDIRMDGNMLTISCEKEETKEEKEMEFNRKEYNYSSFSRSFTLPEEVMKEKIDAVYENGELKLMLPKTEKARITETGKHIPVK
ncbi:Hsp20/alpha crystallin family protein [Lacibacter sp. MH-610]|jgi:HSP20 family protein|uniref:Hsp20/alpha crystallin family protein n=1 Tax=Lacibacter sp. MH-610 TaxID=3020883 RepID=UPI003891FFB4